MKGIRLAQDRWKIPPSPPLEKGGVRWCPPLEKGGVKSLGKIPVIQSCLRTTHRQAAEEWAEGFANGTERFLCSRWLDRAILAVLVFAIVFFGRVFIGHF